MPRRVVTSLAFTPILLGTVDFASQCVRLLHSSHHKSLAVGPKQYFGPFWRITSTHPASHYPEISRQGRGFRPSAASPGGRQYP